VKLVLDNEYDLQENFVLSSPLIKLRLELVSALEAAGDPKKKGGGGGGGKKDKAPTDTVRMNSSNLEVNETVCGQLPDAIVRKCINWRIQKTPKCELSGLVLDAWAPFISSYEQLYEATVSSSVADPADLADYAEVVVELQVCNIIPASFVCLTLIDMSYSVQRCCGQQEIP
jgi:hypothetical protein